MTGLVVRDVELLDGALGRVDVRLDPTGVRVLAVGPGLPANPGDDELDGAGGLLLPGLHDHHVHLLATAAARSSVDLTGVVGVAAVLDRLRAAAAAPGDGWLRATGHHGGPDDPLDRRVLDRAVPHRPVRVQHRSGAQWTLNSAAIAAVAPPDGCWPEGTQLDAAGVPTGRFHRLDRWLGDRWSGAAPSLVGLLAELVAAGVTGVTDCTPWTDPAELRSLADAVAVAPLRPAVVATGGWPLAAAAVPAPLRRGPVKLVVDDGAYPALDELVAQVGAARAVGRPVAVHCVTRVALALVVAALREVGPGPGDRIEHGTVVPPDLRAEVAALGCTVVVQPSFVRERGDDHRREVDPDDRPWLHPARSLVDAGIPVAGGSDGPYTSTDPWAAVATAVDRRTAAGVALHPAEALDPAAALGLFLGPLEDPGGPRRRVAAGAPADLCLLAQGRAELLADPAAALVRATWVAADPAPPLSR